jgi:GNAT superfamily N-acetyltransferase
MQIEKLDKISINDALELVWNVFREFEACEYSEQGVATFKEFISYNSMIKRINNDEIVFWGCFIEKKLVGVIALIRKNHISLLFVLKEYHRRGIAKKLFNVLADSCRMAEEVNTITVNSSPYAVEVYHHLGFKDIDCEQTVDGIRFTPMKYEI